MTSARQVKPVFKKLIFYHADYKIIGSRFLCKTPINHILCGIFIEKSSNKDSLQPQWSVTPLFFRTIFDDILLGTINAQLNRSKKAAYSSWLWSDPTMVGDLIEVIETVAMPKLTLYETLLGYAALPPETYEGFGQPPEDLMLVHIALGELDAAREIWHARTLWHQRWSHQSTPRMRWLQEQLATVEKPLFANDRPALARILHGWESANVRGTEFERYWEPTLFPLEL